MLLGGVGRLMRGVGSNTTFTPESLFASGEQGFWYDPSDFSTMFQDGYGTVPVTAVTQPVAMILDKSKGLVIGSELATSPDLNWDASVGNDTAILAPVVSGRWYRFQWAGLSTTGTGGVTIRVGAATLLSPSISITTTSPATYSGYFLAPATGDLLVNAVGPNALRVGSFSSVSVKEIAGNHAYQPTDTSRPVLNIDASNYYYLAFDGTDDSMLTNVIDFTSGDKFSALVGLRKESDGAQGMVLELSTTSATTPGTFSVQAPGAAGVNDYRVFLRGDTASTGFSATTYSAAITNVLSVVYNIAGADRASEISLRVNAATPTLTGQGSASAGGGNFGNQALYIGRRANVSFPFNGRLYSAIGVARALSGSELISAENWVNSKTGAY